MQHFLSDNSAPAHPEVLKVLEQINQNHYAGYGQDPITEQAINLFRDNFGPDIDLYFTTTGTASNIVSLKCVLETYEAVLCADCAHLNKDECGAPEALVGCKLMTIPAQQGKLSPQLIEPYLGSDMVHRVKPRLLSVSQCSEWGTVYTIEELKSLSDFCQRHQLIFHVDGARFANAACALNVSLKELAVKGGIDILSFGGTKNGLMAAEAVIFFNQSLGQKANYIQKQYLQLASKMRFISAQFIALLNNDLWRDNANHANVMARLLAQQIENDVEIVMPVETNVVFARLPSQAIQPLQQRFPFAVWSENENIVRWMTAFDTEEKTVNQFAQCIKQVIHEST